MCSSVRSHPSTFHHHCMSIRRLLALVAVLLLPLAVSAAGLFPDVGDSHPFKAEIESLARAGVVKGNPDGKFYPDRILNRAELLKMLYTATGRTPNAISSSCFSDVEHGSWYEAYVCDAASKQNGFVQGYSDGKFRPASPVSRTEALKMVFTVFGLSAPDISSNDQDIIRFIDISVTAWYSKYVSAAYRVGILPIISQGGSHFYPEQAMTRGEAAAYIFKALNIKAETTSSASSSSSAQSMSSSSSSAFSSSSSSSSSGPAETLKKVSFPFKDTDRFSAKKSTSYEFELKAAKTQVSITVQVTGYYPSDVTCRLYLLDADGFSDEYYLGVQNENSCSLVVNARPGKYQLQLQPTVADVPFTVQAASGATDGNDGFIDALSVKVMTPRTATLETGDLYDWYSFRAITNQTITVDVTAADKLTCIIYSPSDVDQFGFSGPECGKPYSFVAGETYIVGVGRGYGVTPIKKITYTLKWQ